MLKKVIFAAVLAMGFVTSFKVGAAVDTEGLQECDKPPCQICSPLGCL